VSTDRGTALRAAVVAGDEGTRTLLRGLLQMHRVPVEGEASGETDGFELIRARRPPILVVDVALNEGSANGLIGQSRALAGALRVILIAPAGTPPSIPTDLSERPDVTLLRPFLIREFAEALFPPEAG